MEEYLKRQIMDTSRHQIIYGYNTKERHQFLQELEELYPVKTSSNMPIAIYMKDFILAKPNKKQSDYETISAAGEFLEFTIIENIISKILSSGIKLDEKSQADFVTRITSLFGNRKNEQISGIKRLQELRRALLESKNFYRERYHQEERETSSIDKLPIPFITAESVVPKVKTLLELDSYFGLIFDTDNSVSPISAITINNYIGKRCNADLSIKLACDATSWPTYCSLNGQIDAIHDYGTVELDDCVKQYTKKMKAIKEGE